MLDSFCRPTKFPRPLTNRLQLITLCNQQNLYRMWYIATYISLGGDGIKRRAFKCKHAHYTACIVRTM